MPLLLHRSVILVAFKDFRVPKLIKFADVKRSNEIDHEIEVGHGDSAEWFEINVPGC